MLREERSSKKNREEGRNRKKEPCRDFLREEMTVWKGWIVMKGKKGGNKKRA
jgi:hypothetical protein